MSFIEFEATELRNDSLVRRAFNDSQRDHEGHRRETSTGLNIPYFTHPIRVAEILQRTVDDASPALIASAVSHDRVEDVGTKLDDIRHDLGDEVADTVGGVTLDNDLKGAARRDFQANTIAGRELNVRRLRVADRADNLLSLAFDPPEKRSLKNRLDYIEASRVLIRNANLPDEKLNHLAREALELADRALFVAVREKVRAKGASGRNWNHVTPLMQQYIKRAVADLELEKTLIDENGVPRQKTDDLNILFADANLAQRELRTVLGRLAEFHHLCAEVPETIKDKKRVDEVIATRFKGDARRINDLARASIVCKSMEEVHLTLHALSQSYRILHVYDRFKNPPITGYRDMHLVMRSDQSHFCEVQIHLEGFWNAKKTRGDDLYRQLRELCAQASLTPQEKRHKGKLFEESRALYNAAALAHGLTKAIPVACHPVPVRAILAAASP